LNFNYSLKSKRLNKQSQFTYVFKNCIKKETHLLKGYCAKAQNPDNPGIAIVINRKFGNAVKRNRYRRIIREIIRHNQYSLTTSKDLILILKRTNKDLGYKDIQETLRQLLEQLTIWKTNDAL